MSIQYNQDVLSHLPYDWWLSSLPNPLPDDSPKLFKIWSFALPSMWWLWVRQAIRLFIAPIILFLNGLFITTLGIFALYLWVIPILPENLATTYLPLQRPISIYNAEGLLMGQFGSQYRTPIRYIDTPPLLIKAFLAAEDTRFFEHHGFDMRGLGRAAVNLLDTGGLSQGGSTITMQLVRNLVLSPVKNIQRKLSELILSLRLEAILSKQQIFELYQNRIFFGHNTYGIAAAASTYYNKKVKDLSLAQMATLAGIPQAPSIHNPVTHPKQAIERRVHILNRMLKLGWINKQQYETAKEAPEEAKLPEPPTIEFNAPYVQELARYRVRKFFKKSSKLHERYGKSIYTSGFKITITIDSELQKIAQQVVASALFAYDRRHGYRGPEAKIKPRSSNRAMDKLLAQHPTIKNMEAAIVLWVGRKTARLYLGAGQKATLSKSGAYWAIRQTRKSFHRLLRPGYLIRVTKNNRGILSLTQVPKVEGALVAISPKDGAIKALVGGFDFKHSQFNRAVSAGRSPASTFKPIVYAAALERGYTDSSLIDDAKSNKIRWKRRRRKKKDKPVRQISIRMAIVKSRNFAAVKLLKDLGIKKVRKFAIERFGFPPKQTPAVPSLALGTNQASPLQMAGAYARFANGGFKVKPYLIARIEDPYGKVVTHPLPFIACRRNCRTIPKHRIKRVLRSRTVHMMRSILKDVVLIGTGKRARVLKRNDIAGKTGTSNQVRDAWFCGFHHSLVVVTWMGFDDFKPLGNNEMGGQSALGMWVHFMRKALPK